MRKIVLALALSALAALPCGAQTLYMLNLPSDPRAAAMARTGEINPALMVSESRLSVKASYSKWALSGSANPSLGVRATACIGGKIALGAYYKSFGYSSYNVTDASGHVTGSYKPSEGDFGVYAAFKFGGKFSVGAGVHLPSSKLAEDASAKTFAVDASAAFTTKMLKVSAGVYNIGGKLSYGEQSSCALPTLAKATADVSLGIVSVCGEAGYLFGSGFTAGAGAEVSLFDAAFVRAGYRIGPSDLPSYASFGLGGKFLGITLDASYIVGGGLGNSLLVGAGFSF